MKHYLTLLLLFIGFYCLGQNASSNNIIPNTIKGVVLDEENMPVIGANVLVKGEKSGTITDFDGRFKISAPVKSIVQISYIGSKTKEVTVGENSDLKIVLEQETKVMEEIVVVGYGTQKKVNLTGSISAISATDIQGTASIDVVNSLSGRAPGVRISQYSSEPGSYDTNMDIRGFGTPLYIIDGVERSKEEFSRLSAYEIQDVSILKDASAAIYGVKAANGVVLVTTKSGSVSKPKVSYNGRWGSQNVTAYPQKANGLQYAELWNENTINALLISPTYFSKKEDMLATLKYSPDYIAKLKSGEIASTDYLGLIFKDYSTQQQHSISIDGGSETTKYFVTAGYYGDQGLYKSGSLSSDKYNFRFNFTTKLSESVKFNANIGFINTLKDSPYSDLMAIFKPAISAVPMEGPYANDNPNYLSSFTNSYMNPLAMVDKKISGFQKYDEKFLQTNFELTWAVPFLKGLNAKARYSYDYNNKNKKSFRKPFNLYQYDSQNAVYNAVAYNTPSTVSDTTYQNPRHNIQLSLNYNKSFNKKHNLGALLLFEQIQTENTGTYASTNLNVDLIPDLSSGVASTALVGSAFSETAKRSYVGRLNYDFVSRYLLEVACRYDGSGKFLADSRWGFFPSISAGWRISEEKFIKDHVDFLDNLKLRSSWGLLGDDAASDYQFLTGYNYPTGGAVFANQYLSGLGIQNIANKHLTWYTSQLSNVGIDISLWKSKLYCNVEYFQRLREGLLAYRTLSTPGYFGASLPQENLNSDKTSGYEVVLGHKNNIGKLSYGIEGNVSYARTMNQFVSEAPARDSYSEWQSIKSYRYADVVWGYKTDGVYKSFEEIKNGPIMSANGNRSVLPGDYKFVDVNGDGYIDEKDKRPIGIGGTNKPLLNFGININLAYRGFDFTMLWQGAALNMVRYLDAQFVAPFAWNYANPMEQWYDRWSCTNLNEPYNDKSWVAGKYPAVGSRLYNSGDLVNNDKTYFDARYIRLKNIEIGYTLPKNFSQLLYISKCRFYFNAFNALTFQNGYGFLDPEANSGRFYSYPVTFSLNGGINLTF
jgi:TonB-linked SusC/RagA family outer membrane protein